MVIQLAEKKAEEIQPQSRLAGAAGGAMEEETDEGRVIQMVRVSIYPTFADGKIREILVEAELDPERPLLTPDSFIGRFIDRLPPGDLFEIKMQSIGFEGRRYKFARLEKNGKFELYKDW
jgi:hypothetical protein